MVPQVTILMTTYNGLSFLDENIKSVINQDFKDFEFLIIDDASTDGTYAFIQSIKDSRIKLLRNEKNIGQTASLNKGLDIAVGDLIIRLDQDDVCLKSRVGEQVSFMVENPSVVVASSYEYIINNTGVITQKWMRRIRDRGDFIGYVILGLVPVWHPSVIFRKAIIKKLGGYDTSFGPAEDYHLWSKIAAHGFNASIIPKFHLLQRNHMESQSVVFADAQKIQTIRAQQDFIKNFIYITQNQLPFFSNILRLEVGGLTKDNVIESAKTLENLFEIIAFKLGFSQEESKSLRLRIYKRIGIGFTASKYISELNPRIFMLLFYLLSPMYNSKFIMYARLFTLTVRKSGTLKY